MPEGDTIHRLANQLRPELLGLELVEGSIRGVDHLGGQQVTAVRAVGKNLIVECANRRCLRVHLGMNGVFHRYAPGDRWRRPRGAARVILTNSRIELGLYKPLRASIQPTRDLPLIIGHLGPDLLAEELLLDVILERAAQHTGRALGELLMDQRVAAGIGNVYKSELCFLARLSPWSPAPDGALPAIYQQARALMQSNLGPGRRTTRVARDGQRLWVYRRAGRPCLECGAPIQAREQGRERPRWTWWCPACQPQAARSMAPCSSDRVE